MLDYFYSFFREQTPLCYEIKAPNGKVSYILCTMHYFFNIPPELVEKMNNGSIKHLMVENAPAAKKGKHSFALDDRIVLMAEKKQIPITSLDRQTPNFPYDTLNLLYFFNPEFPVLTHQNVKKEALLYLKQDSTPLNHEVSEFAKKYFLASERNERWIPDMVKGFDQGGALIAAGQKHFLGKEGCINILKKDYKDYSVKPFKITMTVDKNFEKEYTEKYLTDIEFLADIKVSSVLSQLAQAYHQQKLTSDQLELLNQILRIFMPPKYSGINTPLNYCEQKSLAILFDFFEMESIYKLDQKNFISKGISYILDDMKLINLSFAALDERLAILKKCRLLVFYCYLFFPKVLQTTFKNFIIEGCSSTAGQAKVKLLLSCGVPAPWESPFDQYMKKFEPEYFAKIESRTLLPNLFKEVNINFSEDIFKNIFEYSDIPQP